MLGLIPVESGMETFWNSCLVHKESHWFIFWVVLLEPTLARMRSQLTYQTKHYSSFSYVGILDWNGIPFHKPFWYCSVAFFKGIGILCSSNESQNKERNGMGGCVEFSLRFRQLKSRQRKDEKKGSEKLINVGGRQQKRKQGKQRYVFIDRRNWSEWWGHIYFSYAFVKSLEQ